MASHDDTTIYHAYRCTNPDGTQKDWAIGISEHGTLRIRYGVTGATMKLHEISNQPTSALITQKSSREQEKLAKGYRLRGEFCVKQGRLEPIVRANDQAHDLFWEAKESLSPPAVLVVLEDTIDVLKSLELPTVHCSFEEGVGAVLTMLDPTAPEANRQWGVGFGPEGGLLSNGRGGGRVRDADGPFPILLLMRLQQEFEGHIRFADAKAQTVQPKVHRDDPWLGWAAGNFAVTEEAAARLGLCVGRLRLMGSESLHARKAAWF